MTISARGPSIVRTVVAALLFFAGAASAQSGVTPERHTPSHPLSHTRSRPAPQDSAHRLPLRPDSARTPGATLAVAAADVCVRGYSKKVRNVPASVKRQVYASYGITPAPGAYEIDHLISLELGGSNAATNLWPESFTTQPWNAHVKDALENRLHALVCAGSLPLATAQHLIATDWIAAYGTYMRAAAPTH